MQQIAKCQEGARRLLQRRPDKPRLSADQGKAQRRVGELSRLYRDRYPRGLPRNEQGVKLVRYMCRTLAFLPRDDRAKWLDRNASWLDGDRRADILSMGPYMYGDRSLGNHLELDDEERERLGIRTIEACDVTAEQRAKINLEKDRKRAEKRRRQNGAKSRKQYLAESLSRTKPWEADKISRRTWYRQRGTSPSVSSLSYRQSDALVPSAATISAERGENVLLFPGSGQTITTTSPPGYFSLKEAA